MKKNCNSNSNNNLMFEPKPKLIKRDFVPRKKMNADKKYNKYKVRQFTHFSFIWNAHCQFCNIGLRFVLELSDRMFISIVGKILRFISLLKCSTSINRFSSKPPVTTEPTAIPKTIKLLDYFSSLIIAVHFLHREKWWIRSIEVDPAIFHIIIVVMWVEDNLCCWKSSHK